MISSRKELATKVLDFLTEENWNPKYIACDKYGTPLTSSRTERAASFCLVGAAFHLTTPEENDVVGDFAKAISYVMSEMYHDTLLEELTLEQARNILQCVLVMD